MGYSDDGGNMGGQEGMGEIGKKFTERIQVGKIGSKKKK